MQQVEQQLKLIITEGLHFWTNMNQTAWQNSDLERPLT